jgi:diguanylate cyclase (GGDEF)-like protein
LGDDGTRVETLHIADSITASDLEDIGPGSGDPLRRNVLFATTAIACALCVAFWLLGAGENLDSHEQVVIPILSILFGVLSVFAWQGKMRGTELSLVSLGAIALMARIYFMRHDPKPGLIPVLEVYELIVWFPSLFVFAFLVFEKRSALLYSLAVLATSIWIIRDWLIPGRGEIFHADIGEFFLGQLGAILLIYTFSHLKERYQDTHKLAVSLRNVAVTDFLTGVANRRALTESLEQQVSLCDRHGGELSVILLDIDHFKYVNDTHGHDEGDRALRRIAMLVERSRRQTDVFGRWGGEEFLIVAPSLDLDHADAAAERLRGLIETSGRDGPSAVTASFGVAEYRSGDTVASLVKRADEALMLAKQTGRNRVIARSA